MNILCIDIGGGTQDICCFTGKESFENSFKMVMPTPSKRIARQIRSLDGDIFIAGNVIGGGVTGALKEKIAAGHSVFISKNAAATVRDDINYVRSLGITVTEEVLYPDIEFNEFDDFIIIPAANNALNGFEPDVIAVAVQDHGYIKNQSDRVTRFNFLKSFIKNSLEKAYFDDYDKIPPYLTRFLSIYQSICKKYPNKKIIVTDTAVIACLGASLIIEEKKPFITVDAGNCHTFAAAFDESGNITAFFEHHTDSLSKESLKSYLNDLARGDIDGDKIFNEGGHGAFIYKSINIGSAPVLVTGPNRNRFFREEHGVIFADPKGDTMMTGPVGLLMQLGIKP